MHSHRSRTLLMLPVLIAAVLACGPGGAVGPTLAPADSPAPDLPAPAPTLPPAEEPTGVSAPLDPLVVTYVEPAFYIYGLEGALLETRPADGLTYPRPNTAQVGGQDIFYVQTSSDGNALVRRLGSDGTSDLAFTATQNLGTLTFAVSGDGSRLAWSITSFDMAPISRLWIANIDGSGQALVADSETNDDFAEYFVLEPVTWLANGDLVYAWQITGIGGYILFSGWSSLYQYDPDGAAITPLAPLLSDSQGPCWNGLTTDGSYAAGACGSQQEMVERATASGLETHFPILADQGQAGAGAYSPSNDLLAYGIARGDYSDEAGQVVLVAPRGGAPVSIASEAPGYFSRIQWIDESRMVVETSPMEVNQAFVELLDTNGTRTRIGDGRLIGLIPGSGG